MKKEMINWRHVVVFQPVIVALFLFSVYGGTMVPQHLIAPIKAILFFSIFLLFYRWRRLNPNPAPLRLRRLLWVLPLFIASLFLIELAGHKYPQALPWLTLLTMIGGLAWYFLSQRAARRNAGQ